MASSSRFAARKQKVIYRDTSRADFPPLRNNSRSGNAPLAGGVSSSRSTLGASSSAGGDPSSSPHADPMASSTRFRASSDKSPSGSRDARDSSGSRAVASESGGIHSGGGPSWSSLFSSEVKLQFTAPRLVDGKKSISICKNVVDKGVSL